MTTSVALKARFCRLAMELGDASSLPYAFPTLASANPDITPFSGYFRIVGDSGTTLKLMEICDSNWQWKWLPY